MDFWLQDREQAIANVKEAIALSQELGDEELTIDSKLASTKYLPLAEGAALLEELRSQLEARHDLFRLNDLYWRLTGCQNAMGNFEKAIQYGDAELKLA